MKEKARAFGKAQPVFPHWKIGARQRKPPGSAPVPHNKGYALAVLVKVINLSALGKPFSFFVHSSHCQHNVAMGIMPRWVGVMDCKVTAHSL